MTDLRHEVDVEDGLIEVTDLWGAATAEDLRRILVLYPPIRRSADWDEPFGLLAKHHETEPETSAVTAMLLLTDPRWRDGVGQLARRIADSGILDIEQLDVLAQCFIAANDSAYWPVPDDWFSEEGITIEFEDAGTVADQPEPIVDGPTLAIRQIVPPLRRWATERLVRSQPSSWGQLLARTGDVERRGAAAIVLGLLDAIEVLTEPAQGLLIAKATGWPDHLVRRRGFELVVERDGSDAAHAMAKDDPNARLRAWAETLLHPKEIVQPEKSVGEKQRPQTRNVDMEQQTLF